MQVRIDPKPTKVMMRFPKNIIHALLARIDGLKDFPNVKMDIKKLGQNEYRARFGSYRIIFTVVKEKDIIVVSEINTRGKISYAKG
ncbi:MAG: type II toxin-antitoxin system RelE/ParE family toxin [Candidatus Micrarchaeota archaeon]|nr:type II toxin-antitoxin system RelE/ParE family toxin [Candidatus Micrarchaeota archaeon]